MPITLRLPDVDDAHPLSDLLTRNRDYFRTGEPLRSDAFYTPAHQATVITAARASGEEGSAYMFLIEDDGVLVGRANLSSVIRGAFQSASVGYAVDEAHAGRGIATAALRALIDIGFGRLDLHRLQGETVTGNVASQRVLAACGFQQYGTAPDYLRIDGHWQAHELYQLINPNWSG